VSVRKRKKNDVEGLGPESQCKKVFEVHICFLLATALMRSFMCGKQIIKRCDDIAIQDQFSLWFTVFLSRTQTCHYCGNVIGELDCCLLWLTRETHKYRSISLSVLRRRQDYQNSDTSSVWTLEWKIAKTGEGNDSQGAARKRCAVTKEIAKLQLWCSAFALWQMRVNICLGSKKI